MTIKDLNLNKETDAVAFLWSFYSGDEKFIEISEITVIDDNKIAVHWMQGLKERQEWLRIEDIVAIVSKNRDDLSGEPFRISGWNGRVKRIINKEEWDKSKALVQK